MSVVKDIVKALQSKRVLLAVTVAAIVAVNQQLNLMDEAMLTKITALAGTLIIGDAIRPVSPDKK